LLASSAWSFNFFFLPFSASFLERTALMGDLSSPIAFLEQHLSVRFSSDSFSGAILQTFSPISLMVVAAKVSGVATQAK